MERVGFIGLGAMGAPMAWNVHRGGYELAVWNRTASRAAPFRAGGVEVADSPAELAARCDVVVVMVTGPADLLEVLTRPEGVVKELESGMTMINMSTVSRQATEKAAGLVGETGAVFVDAPVSGTVSPAEKGQLVILAGGDDAAIDAVEPLLLTMGRQVVRCGGIGQGTDMKLVINLMLGGMTVLLSEGLALGEALGLDSARILEGLEEGPLGAPLYRMKGDAMRRDSYQRQFPVDLAVKDLDLVLEAAGRQGQPLPATAAVRERFIAARGAGLGDEDLAAVYKVIRQA